MLLQLSYMEQNLSFVFYWRNLRRVLSSFALVHCFVVCSPEKKIAVISSQRKLCLGYFTYLIFCIALALFLLLLRFTVNKPFSRVIQFLTLVVLPLVVSVSSGTSYSFTQFKFLILIMATIMLFRTGWPRFPSARSLTQGWL